MTPKVTSITWRVNAERIVLLDDKQRPTSWVALHEVLRAAPDTPLSRIAVPVPATLVAAMANNPVSVTKHPLDIMMSSIP